MPGRTVPIPLVGSAADLRSAAQTIRAAVSAGSYDALKQALTGAADAFEQAQNALDGLESRLRELAQPNKSNVTRQAPIMVSGDRIAGGITVQGVLPSVLGQSVDVTLDAQVGHVSAINHDTGTNLELDIDGSPVVINGHAGGVVLKPGTNSVTAVQAQNAAGTPVLDVDTTNSRVGVGTAAPTTALDVRGELLVRAASGTGTISVQDSVPTTTGRLELSSTLLKISNNANPIEISANTNAGVANQVYLDNNGNVGIHTANQFGSGTGVVAIANATVVPAATPTGGGVLYVTAGALVYKGSAGTVTPLAPA